MNTLIVITSVTLLLVLYLVFSKEIKDFKSNRKIKKEVSAVTSLAEKKIKDDLDLERDKDLVLIDEYMSYISEVINKFNTSRSKKVSLNTRQILLSKTIQMIFIFDKYITIDFYYDPYDPTFKNLTDRELMELLESVYNDFTHNNLECFNNILSLVIRLRDGGGK